MPTDHVQFRDWLRDRARARGYDIDSPRGGGKAQLAEDSGVSRGQVGRALAGETVPDIGSQRGLAKALGVPLEEMLIRSGLCEPEDFPSFAGRPYPPKDSLDALVDRLGVTDLERRILGKLIDATLEAMRDPQYQEEQAQTAAADAEADQRRF